MSGISILIFWLLPGIMFPYLSTIFSPVTYCWAVTAPTFSFHTPLDVTGESPDVHNIMTTELALTIADYLATLGGQIHPPICPGGVPAANYSVIPIYFLSSNKVFTFITDGSFHHQDSRKSAMNLLKNTFFSNINGCKK